MDSVLALALSEFLGVGRVGLGVILLLRLRGSLSEMESGRAQ